MEVEGKLFQSEISWDSLQLNDEDIYLSMGANYTPDENVLRSLDLLKKEIRCRTHPRYLYTFCKPSFVTPKSIGIRDIELHTGAIITPYLQNADWYAVFVATAGHEFEQFQDQIKETEDIFQEFLLDALGTAVAEAAVREVCHRIEEQVMPLNYGVSYPYSPGYCGWHVTQQQLLFSLLPTFPCGIRLSSSSLMAPIKSVSGVVAVGEKVIKQKYGCELCGKKDCYKNKNK